MRKIIQIVFLFMFTVTLQSQSNFNWNSKKNTIKIPFELTHNLIIVDVDFNGVPLKMILDTGSDRSMLFSFPENDSLVLNQTDKIEVRGVGNDQSITAYLSKNNILKINEFEDSNFEILLIPDQEITLINKIGLPINGILGSTFFKQYVTKIDYDKKCITLFKNSRKQIDKAKRNMSKCKVEIDENKPYMSINTELEGKETTLKLLFDTGLGEGLWLFENNKIKCSNFYINDVLGRGLSGDIEGKKARIKNVVLSNYEFENVIVSYPDSVFFKKISIYSDRNGSLGGEVIKRFNWLLDYANSDFYFEKNMAFDLPFNYNMSGIEVQHFGFQWVKEGVNVNSAIGLLNLDEFYFERGGDKNKYKYELKPIFEIYSIRKDSPADIAGLKVGDKIIKLNNKGINQLSIQNITDVFQSEDGKLITIIIERKNEQITFKFNLKKIL